MKPSETFSYKIHALVCALDEIADRLIREHGDLNFPQFELVLCVVENPGETQKSAARWLQLTEATISYTVKRLAQKKYLAIKDDPVDGRTKRLYATKKGEAAVKTIYPVLEKALAPHLHKINPADLAKTVKSMDIIMESITVAHGLSCDQGAS